MVELEEWVIRMLDGVVDDVGGVVPTRPQANLPQATLMIGFPTRPQANNAASNLDDRVQTQDSTTLCGLAR